MNIFKNFSRNFKHNRLSSIINMLSLIPGLACCLLIVMWIVGQVETDRSFKNIDRIVTLQGYHEGQNTFWGVSPAVAPVLKMERPEIEKAVRIRNAARTVKYETENFGISAYDADYDLFDLFSLTTIEGRPFTEGEKDRCVLTRKAAKIIFGNKSPIDQALEFDFGTFTVCGVIENLPLHRTVARQGREEIIFLPIERNQEGLSAWYNNSFESYVLLKDMTGFEKFATEIKDRAIKAQPEMKLYIKAGKLKDRYLHAHGHIREVRLMGLIALVILLIACINFVNLSTAAFSQNAVQTGIRKVVGATRKSLIAIYLSNTFILVLISYFLAFLLAYVIVPVFGTIIGSNFRVSDLLRPEVFWIGGIMLVITTLLAGLYPSFYLSSFLPVKVLKGRNAVGLWSARLRQSLVVLQFAVSITLIACTLIISRQIRMYQNMDLGYKWDEVLYISLRNQAQVQKAFVLRDELVKDGGVRFAAVSTSIPTSIYWNGVGFNWEGKDPLQNPLISMLYADENFFKVYDIRLKEGEFFTESQEGVVVNRKLAELMGGNALDKYFQQGEETPEVKVLGVVDQFLFNDFKAEEEPLVIFPIYPEERKWVNIVSIRVSGEKLGEVYDRIKKRTEEIFGEPPVIRFLNGDVEYWLASEKQTSHMVSFFSVLAILISCLGLFGLATFMMEQKRKEIGIRRVNGARISEIVWLLNVNFLKPILVGFVIACPLAYYFMNRWLESYLKRTEMSWWIFIVAGALTAAIALITLLWRSLKAAMENPVNSLKSE